MAAQPAAAPAAAAAACELCCRPDTHSLPPSRTAAELAAVFSQLCTLDQAPECSSGSSGGAGLGAGAGSTLPLPAERGPCAAEQAAGCTPSSGAHIARTGGSPAGWLRDAISLQLLAGGNIGQVPPAQQSQQSEPRCSSGSPPLASGFLAAAASSSGGMSPCSGGRSTAGSLSRSSSSAASLAASSDAEAGGGSSCLVVHNLPLYLSAQAVGQFFAQFGEVVECSKPQGASLAFVHFADAAAAACARRAVHYKLVPQLNPREALSIQYRKGDTKVGSSSGGGTWGSLRSSSWSGGGGRPGTSDGGSDGSSASASLCSFSSSSSDGGGSAGSPFGGGGPALVVTNLHPGVTYEAVRAFFRRFGKLAKCYRQPQTEFAFLHFSDAATAAAALRAVSGTLCPDLNPACLIKVEFRRGLGATKP